MADLEPEEKSIIAACLLSQIVHADMDTRKIIVEIARKLGVRNELLDIAGEYRRFVQEMN